MTDAPPKLPYWHLWADDEGVTHQTRCEVSGFNSESVGGEAAPEWIKHLLSSEATLLIRHLACWLGGRLA